MKKHFNATIRNRNTSKCFDVCDHYRVGHILCSKLSCTRRFNYGADLRIRDVITNKCVYIASSSVNVRVDMSDHCDDDHSQFFYNEYGIFMSESYASGNCIKPNPSVRVVMEGSCGPSRADKLSFEFETGKTLVCHGLGEESFIRSFITCITNANRIFTFIHHSLSTFSNMPLQYFFI